jgi:hypothetical protein
MTYHCRLDQTGATEPDRARRSGWRRRDRLDSGHPGPLRYSANPLRARLLTSVLVACTSPLVAGLASMVFSVDGAGGLPNEKTEIRAQSEGKSLAQLRGHRLV